LGVQQHYQWKNPESKHNPESINISVITGVKSTGLYPTHIHAVFSQVTMHAILMPIVLCFYFVFFQSKIHALLRCLNLTAYVKLIILIRSRSYMPSRSHTLICTIDNILLVCTVISMLLLCGNSFQLDSRQVTQDIGCVYRGVTV